MPSFSQEQLSSAAGEDVDKPLGDDWDVIGRADIPHVGAGQHLTTKALEKLQAMLPPVLGLPNNVGQWARSWSSHGDGLDAERPQEGMPPADRVGLEAAEAERPRGHSKSPSSSRPSTNASEGFAPAERQNQADMDLMGAGSKFVDEPTPYAATRPSLEELDLQPRNAPGPRAAKGHK